LFVDNYFETYSRFNVTLIDTKGRGFVRITANGIVFDGKEIEVDCIIYSRELTCAGRARPMPHRQSGVHRDPRTGLQAHLTCQCCPDIFAAKEPLVARYSALPVVRSRNAARPCRRRAGFWCGAGLSRP